VPFGARRRAPYQATACSVRLNRVDEIGHVGSPKDGRSDRAGREGGGSATGPNRGGPASAWPSVLLASQTVRSRSVTLNGARRLHPRAGYQRPPPTVSRAHTLWPPTYRSSSQAGAWGELDGPEGADSRPEVFLLTYSCVRHRGHHRSALHAAVSERSILRRSNRRTRTAICASREKTDPSQGSTDRMIQAELSLRAPRRVRQSVGLTFGLRR
jgi:hypothetical protein